MDIGELSARAIDLVVAHLGAVASNVVGRAEDLAAEQLFRLVSDRLRATEMGSAALRGLEERPSSSTRQQIAAAALTEAATDDEEFAVQLRNATLSIAQGQAVDAMIRNQANVSVGGNMSLSRSDIAGSIDKSRRSLRIGLGGYLLAGAVLLGGITTGVVIGTDGDDPPDPTTASPVCGRRPWASWEPSPLVIRNVCARSSSRTRSRT
jgi:hypothetical protein